MFKRSLNLFLLCYAATSSTNILGQNFAESIQSIYEERCCATYHIRLASNIYEHVPVLKELAKQCESITEIGVESVNATWGLLAVT